MEHQASAQQSVLCPRTGVVEIRDFRCSDRPHHTGVRGLPLAVVALHAKRGLNRILGPLPFRPLPAVEIPRILMQKRLRQG